MKTQTTISNQCPLCSSKAFSAVFNDFGYDKKSYFIVRCDKCYFQFLDPQPNDEELEVIYANYYGAPGEEHVTESHLNFRKPVFDEVCRKLEHLKGPGASLLDVGCGNGDFLMMARERGWSVAGIDVATTAVDYAKKQRGLDVQRGSLENLPFKKSSFEVVTLLDVLEHLRSPRQTLRSIYEILKPGGELVIRVPNTPFQIAKARFQRMRHGKNFTTLATPLHLNHFDDYTLRRLVEDVGFSVESVAPGEADGEGRSLALKRAYVFFSKFLVPAGIQVGNILMLSAVKN